MMPVSVPVPVSVTRFANSSDDRMSLLKQLWGVSGWLDNDGCYLSLGMFAVRRGRRWADDIDMRTS